MNYGFIGLGNMASAIIKGMVSVESFSAKNILGYDPYTAGAKALAEATGITLCASNVELAKAADVIVIAVKPQMMAQALKEIAGVGIAGKLFISIAAGKDIKYIQDLLGPDAPIVRIMPNINAKVRAATSGLAVGPKATEEHRKIARDIFATIGTVTELPESQLGAFMVVASAAPAFSYMYIDALARAGVRFGLSKKLALEIAASQVFGSAKMVMESKEHPFDLIDQVCSPAGTTIEGITALQANGFEAAVHKAVEAVLLRDRSL
ncbi:MAG: pyrroline-5-carboxylate reductase [Deltaproteobacteria bacterium]|jgi:pyrroline-5-carboxylate reductase|nr:pyrroline-5-carboxylate reductase [Deltaproteobacteria bacterium]